MLSKHHLVISYVIASFWCVSDQQFLTLLFYVDGICTIAPDVSVMMDCIKLVFIQLKEFHLKIKLEECYFLQARMIFLVNILSAMGISANHE